jgi:hypothetical protein
LIWKLAAAQVNVSPSDIIILLHKEWSDIQNKATGTVTDNIEVQIHEFIATI